MTQYPRIEQQWSFRLGNLGFIVGLILLAAVSAWPIYQSGWYLGVVCFGVLAALAAVFAVWNRSNSVWLLSGILVLVYLVFGVLVAYPELYQSGQQLFGIWFDALASGVTGWKDLVTITLPVGSYKGLLIPAFMVFLFGSGFAFFTGLRARNTVGVAVIVLSGMMLFGLVFGAGHGEGIIRLLNMTVLGFRELVLGGAFFLLTVFWLAWRSYAFRHAALSRARTSSGVVLKKTLMTRASRVVLGFGMLAIALLLATLVTPPLMTERSREVLRTAIDPEQLVAETLSPLANYRDFVLNHYDTELFRVQNTAEVPERIRLVALNYYDGQTYQVGSVGSGSASAGEFIRIPYQRELPSGATEYTYEIQLADSTELWLPVAGQLGWVEFLGENRSALSDGFYYQPELQTALSLATVDGEAHYRMRSAVVSSPELSSLEPLSLTSLNNPQTVPEELLSWLELQQVPKNGAGLEQLIDRLRTRGYLSHSLNGTFENEAPYPWIADLPRYDFMPSLAGHNTERIGTLFEQLLTKENRVGTSGDENLVAAIGDDEQFSVAIALLAGELGFDARVVLGAYLQAGSGEQYRIPACESGICRGKNIASWVEVRGQSGEWVEIDSTPQFAQLPTEDEEQLQDPKNTTNVDADKASVIPPQQNLPEAGDQQEQSDDEIATGIPFWLWAVLKQIALWSLALLLLLAPFVVVFSAKAIRRLFRQRAASNDSRILGGWEEYLDHVTDLGAVVSWNSTRAETAKQLAGPHSTLLANWADHSQYAGRTSSAETADEYWKLVRQDLREQRKKLSFWQRLGAMISVKSFTRHLVGSGARLRGRQSSRNLGGSAIGITLASQSALLGRKVGK